MLLTALSQETDEFILKPLQKFMHWLQDNETVETY